MPMSMTASTIGTIAMGAICAQRCDQYFSVFCPCRQCNNSRHYLPRTHFMKSEQSITPHQVTCSNLPQSLQSVLDFVNPPALPQFEPCSASSFGRDCSRVCGDSRGKCRYPLPWLSLQGKHAVTSILAASCTSPPWLLVLLTQPNLTPHPQD